MTNSEFIKTYASHPVYKAPRGMQLHAKSWQTEAPLRMLLNNLDGQVAENPDELVVYGGIGQAARNLARPVTAPPRRRRIRRGGIFVSGLSVIQSRCCANLRKVETMPRRLL